MGVFMSRDLFKYGKISDNISKTVQDSFIVSIKFEQEVVCALSNGYVTDDLVTHNQLKPPEFLHVALPYASS